MQQQEKSTTMNQNENKFNKYEDVKKSRNKLQ